MKSYIPVKSALKTRPEGDMLIVANNNSEIYYLNGIAGEIWDMIEFIRDMQWKRLIRLKEVV